MSIVDEVKDILKDERCLEIEKKSTLQSSVIKKYNDMLTKGIAKPRGNCLMPTSKLYTQTVMFNKKTFE